MTHLLRLFAVLTLLALPIAPLRAETPAPMVPMAGFDAGQLLGDWFEAAATPNRLERDCHGTTVRVETRDDSRLNLKISCPKGRVDGKVLPIDGVLVETDPGVFQLRLVRLMEMGNLQLVVLWIAPDASMAVISAPDGAVGWVWSKAPHPDPAALQAAKAMLVKVGFVAKAVRDVDQGSLVSGAVDTTKTLSIPDQISPAACLRAGGQTAGMAGQACVFPTPDGGKTCRDGSECSSGACLAFQPGQTTGECAAMTTTFGCYAIVKDGISSPMLCAD